MMPAIKQFTHFASTKRVRRLIPGERNNGQDKRLLAHVLIVLTVSFAASVSGCADIKPWVKPYERDNLADPIMSLSRHGYADAYMHHVYQAREGARGAEGGTGGGCGCN
jgi:Domain of unknown function (DUF4266)